MTDITKLEKQIAEKEARCKEIWDIKKPLDAELTKLRNQIEKIQDKITEAKLKKNMTLGEKIEWLLHEDGYSSDMKRYYEAQKFIEEMGLRIGGYYPYSEQKAVEIVLYKGDQDNLEKTFESLSVLLPFIKPIDEAGNRRFKLFEHTLSENGIYDLLVDVHGAWTLNKTTYGRESVLKTFDNLRDALKYCQEHHYYQSSEDGDNDF